MKIIEAKQLYSAQLQAYREQQTALVKQKQELEQKMNIFPNEKQEYENEAVILDLTLEAVIKKQDEYEDYMEKLNCQWTAISDMVSSKQQSEAAKEYAQNMGKVMEVARRLMKGAVVPAKDEQKLMEYSMELYQAAKNIGSMAKREKKEKYDSLWDKEEKTEYEDATEVANNSEAIGGGPEIVDVAETVADVEVSE